MRIIFLFQRNGLNDRFSGWDIFLASPFLLFFYITFFLVFALLLHFIPPDVVFFFGTMLVNSPVALLTILFAVLFLVL